MTWPSRLYFRGSNRILTTDCVLAIAYHSSPAGCVLLYGRTEDPPGLLKPFCNNVYSSWSVCSKLVQGFCGRVISQTEAAHEFSRLFASFVSSLSNLIFLPHPRRYSSSSTCTLHWRCRSCSPQKRKFLYLCQDYYQRRVRSGEPFRGRSCPEWRDSIHPRNHTRPDPAECTIPRPE